MRRAKGPAIAILVLLVLGAVVFYATRDGSTESAERPLEDSSFVIEGRRTTCTQLFRHPCDYSLQLEFNRSGHNLENFVNSEYLGPYAENIGFAESAKLALQACVLSHTAGKTILEFVEVGRADHPDAGLVELFPFWNRARQQLCPMPWQ
ncbi:hypothetical protein [Rhodococcus chondri]|uniref:Uncharacterized protein n=1 Tax=Rhodococcus chondri TaxID=3065941 RepID=A0ABU7JRK1_9NOCA|nr:hypothetical protein [Rhodococcus sp. CC-R104]MEE2032377.1 hypothetical protein [Rhodococcus sp. CC-R104]